MTTRKHPHCFDFYVDDFKAGTAEMTNEELGVFIRLLMIQWPNREITGRFQKRLFDGLSEDSIETVKEKFRELENGSLVNDRLEEEYAKQCKLRETRARNGRKGGRPKKLPETGSLTDGKPAGLLNETEHLTEKKATRRMEEGGSLINRRKESGENETDHAPAIDLPFDDGEFPGLWQRYCRIRAQSGDPVTEDQARSLLDQLRRIGPHRAVEALLHTTANGWKQIREPEQGQLDPAPPPRRPAKMDGDHARYLLIKVHKVSEAREWTPEQCLAELNQRVTRPPPPKEPTRPEPPAGGPIAEAMTGGAQL